MKQRTTRLDLQIQAGEAAVWAADRELADTARALKGHARKWSSYARPAMMLATVVALRRVPGWIIGSLGQAPEMIGRARRAGRGVLILRTLMPVAASWLSRRLRADSGAGTAPAAEAPAGAAQPAPRVSAVLDRDRFSGRWFVVAKLGPIDSPPAMSARDYAVADDGFEVVETTLVRDGPTVRSVGRVRQPWPLAHPAELEITFASGWSRWLPGSWAEHWVLEIDAGYQFALIGNRARTELRVLSRNPLLGDAIMGELLDSARLDGYPVEQMRTLQAATDDWTRPAAL